MVILFKRCTPGISTATGTPRAGISGAPASAPRSSFVGMNLCCAPTAPRTQTSTTDDLPQVKDIFERRLLYFSLPEGTRSSSSVSTRSHTAPSPSPIMFDGPIVGPWSRYATVWRVALELPTDGYMEPKLEFFFW